MERPIVDLCEQLMERMRGHGFELSSPVPLSREEMRAALRPWVTQPELVDDDVVDWFAYWWNDELALPRYSFLFPGDPMDRTYYEPYWHYHRQNLLSNNPPGPGFPNPELILPIDEYDLAFFSVVAPRPDDGKWVLYNWAMDGHDSCTTPAITSPKAAASTASSPWSSTQC